MKLTPRRQGDLGEFSAIEYFGSQGIPLYLPVGHSPDVDLVAWLDDRFIGIQVKTSGVFRNGRWEISICTRGGNQSWNGTVKHFSATRCDYLFVLVGDGRRWLIPAGSVEGGSHIVLGGPKYEAFEVDAGRPFPSAAVA